MRTIELGDFGLMLVGSLVMASALLACGDSVQTPAPAPAPAPSSIVAAPPTTAVPPTTTTGTTPVLPGDPGTTPPTTTPPPYTPPGTQPPYTPPGTQPPYTGNTCSVQTGNQSCDLCLQQGCCAQLAACDADPTCGQVDVCAAQCYQQYANNPQVEQQCEQQCYTSRPTGGQKLDAIYQCMGQYCAGQCPQ